MADSPKESFKVVRSEAIRQQLKGWAERAKALGIATDFAVALREMEEQLASNPLTWGDPVKQLRSMGLLVCRRIHWNILVRYAVHEASQTVFIVGYEQVLNNPLRPRDDTSPKNGSA